MRAQAPGKGSNAKTFLSFVCFVPGRRSLESPKEWVKQNWWNPGSAPIMWPWARWLDLSDPVSLFAKWANISDVLLLAVKSEGEKVCRDFGPKPDPSDDEPTRVVGYPGSSPRWCFPTPSLTPALPSSPFTSWRKTEVNRVHLQKNTIGDSAKGKRVNGFQTQETNNCRFSPLPQKFFAFFLLTV